MGNKATDDQIVVVRSIVGASFSEMDIIRALHLANNDATAAINILFDSPPVRSPSSSSAASRTAACGSTKRQVPSEPSISSCTSRTLSPGPVASSSSTTCSTVAIRDDSSADRNDDSLAVSLSMSPTVSCSHKDWWFVGTCDVAGLSTCKGRRLKPGEKVTFSFPRSNPPPPPCNAKFPAKGRSIASCSEIVRFSSHDSGEIGRIPNEWARCLLPLVPTKKIRIEGYCKSAPEIISIMDTIILTISVYINVSVFVKCRLTSAKSITQGRNEESTYFPLLAIFKLLGLVPFKKAEFTPEDLYKRKRPFLESQDGCELHTSAFLPEKTRKHSPSRINREDEQHTGTIPDMDNIIGTTDSSRFEEMDPPDYLECELHPYQKQALHWMVYLERGGCSEEAATTLHPCYNAYRLADKRAATVYLNVFSGDATIEFPSTIQMARGGILADEMGLGKTIMAISLLLKCPAKWELHVAPAIQLPNDVKETICDSDQCSNSLKKTAKNCFFSKLMKSSVPLVEGRNLIICPMTLLGQWKAEIETHTKPGCLTVYVHYGQSRPKDAKHLAQYDVVLTTYGVLSSEFLPENSEGSGGLYCVRWFRVILDEAHMIKSSKSQTSLAAAAISAGRRWCLTGTPIQNNLEDVYSLLRFLRIEPWGNKTLWNKLIQKPYEDGDVRGLKLVQSILKPIMLRRTKFSTDSEGRPIVVLPPINADVIYCEFTEAEKDFYEALYNKSKVKFNQFVEQGRVLHNYASILELLLRLRQCCDHPFLVMSRGDTQEFSNLNKLAKRFLKGSPSAAAANSNNVPSSSYVVEVVEKLRKGEKGECPICLETFEDAVLTPCAHCLCRECLLSSWKGARSGLCPICRQMILRHDLITAPSESRFQIDVENNWVESSKVSALMKELENLRTTGSKSIVFSQWTAFLDLLQIPLSRKNMMFVRLDGTLNQQQREKVIKRFMEENDILVLLMSLKAGGVGINLTAASNAFILDPWWNPAVEEQAVMRVHRIGQSKSVSIKRFIVKGTVEDKMVSVQERKQRMISGALTDEEVRAARIEELKLLFS